jgi:hypothetical protein
VFNLLNRAPNKGKFPARMCKILNILSQFFCSLWRPFSRILYLFEGKRLNCDHFGPVGHRIALLDRQLVLSRIRSGKD